MNQFREIFDHKVTALNEQHIRVFAVDEPGAGGANHKYEIRIETDKTFHVACEINFQHGALQEVGINGITEQALLAICVDRLQSFQKGEFSCRENACAKTHIEEALMWTGKRAGDRKRRGVEGTHQK